MYDSLLQRNKAKLHCRNLPNAYVLCVNHVISTGCWMLKLKLALNIVRGSPHSTNFALPGNRTIAKIVLSGDWFSIKITIYDFWIFKVPFFSPFYKICPSNLTISSFSYSVSRFRGLFAAFIKNKCCKSFLISRWKNHFLFQLAAIF